MEVPMSIEFFSRPARTRGLVSGALLASLAVTAGCGRSAAVQTSASLVLRREVVYRNGVGYFERQGHVSEGDVRFRVTQREVDDFLATLAVMEQGGSSVRSAAFPLPEAHPSSDAPLGDFGTMGHGAGSGLGYGAGAGRGRRGRGDHQPLVRAAPPTVAGLLAPEAIRRVVLRNLGRVNHRHEQALAQRPSTAGRVVIRCVIGQGRARAGRVGRREHLLRRRGRAVHRRRLAPPAIPGPGGQRPRDGELPLRLHGGRRHPL
jgi:hypothetical protein